jgi:hypothetical protein
MRCGRTEIVFALLAIFILVKSSLVMAQQESGTAKGFLIDSQPQGANVHIENEIIGKTPCWFPYELSGRYKIWTEKRGYENQSRTIDFGKRPLTSIGFKLSAKNGFKAALRSMVITGWGQSYSEQNLKGKVFLSLQVATLLSVGYAQYTYNQRFDDYNKGLQRYDLSSKYVSVEQQAWADVTEAHKKLDDAYQLRQTLLYAAAAVYAVNVIDAILFFPKNLRQIEILGFPMSKPAISSNRGMITLSWAF